MNMVKGIFEKFCFDTPFFNQVNNSISRILFSLMVLVIFVSGFSGNVLGQTVTIWSENFNYSDETTSATKDGIDWSTSGVSNGNGVAVYNNTLQGRRTNQGGRDTWNTTTSIDISGYFNVTVTAGISSAGDLNTSNDYVQVQYSLDGGNWTIFESNGFLTGQITGTITASQKPPPGNLLLLRIILRNNSSDEYYFIQNITVTGILSSTPDCSNPIIPADGSDNTNLNTNIYWNSDLFATGYYFYFGTDDPPTNIVNGSSFSSTYYFPPSDLNTNTTYYWKVVPYNSGGAASDCPVWSFTTGTVAIEDTTIRQLFNAGEDLFFTFPFNGCAIISDVLLTVSVKGDINGNSANEYYLINGETGNIGQVGPTNPANSNCDFETKQFTISNNDIQFYATDNLIEFVADPQNGVEELCPPGDPSYVEMTLRYSYATIPLCVISAPSAVCANEQNIIISAPDEMESYTWSITSGDAVINGSNSMQNVVVNAGSSDFTIELTIESYPGCGSSCSVDVNVRPVFSAGSISTSGQTICYEGDPLEISSSTAASGGDSNITYQWQSSTDADFNSPVTINSNTATYDPPANLTVNTWYRRLAKDNTCNSDFTTSAGVWAVTVYPETLETPGAITGTTAQCPSMTGQVYSISAVTNATNYNWTVPTGWTITGGTGTTSITVTTGETGQNGNITVSAENSCGISSIQTLVVTVNPGAPSTPGAITGTAIQCPSLTGQVYSISAVTNSTSYNWTVPTGWTITGGEGTTSITVTTGTAGQNGNITVSAQNSCGTSSSQSLAVVIEPINVTATLGVVSGNYSTIKAAFDQINNGTHRGAIVIQINCNTTETASAVLNASGSGSASYTSVNIYPTASGITVGGNLNGVIIDLNGADNVIIDGRVNGSGTSKSLTIENTNTGTSVSAIRFVGAAENNVIRHCVVKSSSRATTLGGTIFFSSAATGNGNSGNTITNCDITTANSNPDNRPMNSVYSAGSVNFENKNNTISNNNFYDFFRSTATSYGINVFSNSQNWIISNNSFYETTTFTATGNFVYRPFYLAGATVTGFNIDGNNIGGSAANCGGTAWTVASGGLTQFIGIDITAVGTSSATTVQNNTIKNIDLSSLTLSTTVAFRGIYTLAGTVDILNNTIGSSTGNGSIIIRGAAASGVTLVNAIQSASVSNVKIQGNNIGSIDFEGGSANGCTFNGIITSGTGGNFTISNNVIGSESTLNSIKIGTSGVTTTGVCTFVGISSGNTGPTSVSLNTIQNCSTFGTAASTIQGINNTGASTAVSITENLIAKFSNTGTGIIRGINLSNTSASCSVTSNIIRNISSANSITGISTTSGNDNIESNQIYGINATTTAAASVTGILVSAGATKNLHQNTIYNLSSGAGVTSGSVRGIAITGGTTVNVYQNTIYGLQAAALTTGTLSGIQVAGATTSNVYRNKIYDLSYTGSALTTGTINGLHVSALGATGISNIYNNLIGNINASGVSSTTDVVRGINITANTASSRINLYFNTVYLNSTSSGANFSSTGIYHATSTTSTTAALEMQNNLIVNLSAPKGTGVTTAFRRSSGTANSLNNYLTTSNNNSFFAGTPGTANLIYFDGTAGGRAQTIDAYKSAVFTSGTINPRDQASVSVNPTFKSLVGSSSDFLHLADANCELDGKGIPVTGITNDFDNETRDAGFPDIGADEFISILANPVIDTQPVSAANVCIGETLSDLTVVVSGGLTPLSYQWYSNTVNNNSGGTLISGANSSGYAPPTGLSGVVYYYCKITSNGTGCGSAVSNTAMVKVNLYPATGEIIPD